jgi:hypothetical protein
VQRGNPCSPEVIGCRASLAETKEWKRATLTPFIRGYLLIQRIYKQCMIVAMQHLIITAKVLEKLKNKHAVDRSEVEQCFFNMAGKLLTDNRELRRTNPPTLWFISKTNKGRFLKIVYIQKLSEIHLKSAFAPSAVEIAIYARHG